MANAVYAKGLLEIMSASTDLDSSTLIALLMQSAYSFNAANTFVSDLTNEISVGGYSRQTLANKVVGLTGTTFAYLVADALAFGSLTIGQTIGGLVVARQTGSDSTSPLLFFIDLPDTATTGGAVTFTPATAANGGFLKGVSA